MASSATVPTSTAIARHAFGPSATVCRRTSSGLSTMSTSSSAANASTRGPRPVHQERVALGERQVVAAAVLAQPPDAEHGDAGPDQAGEHDLADHPRAGPDDQLRDAHLPAEQRLAGPAGQRRRRDGEPVPVDQGRDAVAVSPVTTTTSPTLEHVVRAAPEHPWTAAPRSAPRRPEPRPARVGCRRRRTPAGPRAGRSPRRGCSARPGCRRARSSRRAATSATGRAGAVGRGGPRPRWSTSTSGSPISPNSKNPNRSPVASNRASDTMTLTVLPLSTSSAPALAANASGMSICDVDCFDRRDASTTTGSSAAAAPFGRDQRRHDRGQAHEARSAAGCARCPARVMSC